MTTKEYLAFKQKVIREEGRNQIWQRNRVKDSPIEEEKLSDKTLLKGVWWTNPEDGKTGRRKAVKGMI